MKPFSDMCLGLLLLKSSILTNQVALPFIPLATGQMQFTKVSTTDILRWC